MKIKIVILFTLLSNITFSQKKVYAKAQLKSVNLYQGSNNGYSKSSSAELVNTVAVSIPKGASEIVIGNISAGIKNETIQIGFESDKVAVISKQFTNNYADFNDELNKNPKFKKINDSIKIIDKLLIHKRIDKVANKETLELLNENKTVLVGSKSSSVSDLIQLTQFYTQKNIELNRKGVMLSEEISKLKKQQERLSKSLISKIEGTDKIAKGVLILKVMATSRTSEKITLKYLTSGASWTPFYEIKATSITQPLKVGLKATINQSTGLDWNNVKLTLISGTYKNDSKLPEYESDWFLDIYNQNKRRRNTKYLNKNRGRGDNMASNNFKSGQGNYSGIASYSSIYSAMPVANQLNITYPLPVPQTILSNGKAHTFNLFTQKVTADYIYASVPNISSKAFLIAKIKDWNEYGIISAKANIIFENMYVGKTQITPSSADEEMVLTLGTDARVNIERKEIKNKSGRKFLSKYQERTITYDLIVRNNKKDKIIIDLKDRIPASPGKDVKVEILETSRAKHEENLNTILHWKLNIGSGKTKKVRVSYKITYPKKMEILNLK